eukprot:GAHX01000523.1.p1 GENE.GAHX01000523.1~~GAHX01000523.1.p1  ORF type:complete len:179 (+),score=28.54 GAHX01000523.1:39-575(+)
MGNSTSKQTSTIFSEHISFPENAYRSFRISWDKIKNGDYTMYETYTSQKKDLASTPVVFFYDRFYMRLTEIEPALKPNVSNMQTRAKFLTALIRHLDNICEDRTLGITKISGENKTKLKETVSFHKEMGISRKHYMSIAHALIWTLEQLLDGKFSADAKMSWIASLNEHFTDLNMFAK